MTDRPVGGRANPAAVGQRLQQDGDVVVGWREVQGSPAAWMCNSTASPPAGPYSNPSDLTDSSIRPALGMATRRSIPLPALLHSGPRTSR